MSKSREELLSHARKLKEHATRGVPNERDVAKDKYESFLKKHSLLDAEVDPELTMREFTAKEENEKDLLLTVILSVNPYARYTQDIFTIKCDLDDEDFSLVNKKYQAFLKIWRVEKELLVTAFYAKHNKYFQPNPNAHKKWNAKNTKNDSIQKNKDELNQVAEEWQKMKSDFIHGKVTEKTLARDVIESQDRVKIQAFNTNRAQLLEAILLTANF